MTKFNKKSKYPQTTYYFITKYKPSSFSFLKIYQYDWRAYLAQLWKSM